ncbi:MAG TPA: TIGR01212 family radical SAM protein [Prolixibacteraceae bacterium]|nr:TIGR01212 family radical SAM protein [Prolixibacteraceae bacterium]
MQHREFPWGSDKRYNDYSAYFRRRFEGRVQKISLDAGFSCPNRDGSKGVGGCTYCNNKSFNPDYCRIEQDIANQIVKGIDFFSAKYPSMRYLAYFQAYSNTYAPVDVLRQSYEEALRHPEVIGLVIATRPDCLSDEVLDLLTEFSERCYLSIELGIESFREESLQRINRGHSAEESFAAIHRIAERKIDNCVHLILGLPGETDADFIGHAKTLSGLPVQSIKLHQLQIHKGTMMAREYRDNPSVYHLFEVDEYADLVVRFLENLSPDIIVQRFVSSAPAGLVIAPNWGLKNYEFVAKVDKLQAERDSWQGKTI